MCKPPRSGTVGGCVDVLLGGCVCQTVDRQEVWVPPFFLDSGPRTAGSLTVLGRLPADGAGCAIALPPP